MTEQTKTKSKTASKQTKTATPKKTVAKQEVRILVDGIVLGDPFKPDEEVETSKGQVLKVTPAQAKQLVANQEAQIT